MKDYTNNYLNHIKTDNNVEYIKFKKMDVFNSRVKQYFLLKHGGVSKGYLASLNFKKYDDNVDEVNKNFEILCKALDINQNDVVKARQNHTDNILILDNTNKEKYLFSKNNDDEYDAYITNEKNIAIMLVSADCNIVTIYDKTKNVIAGIHSGWKGTVKRIAIKTAIKMNEIYGSNYEDMIVCIGPSINKCCWESKDLSLREQFVKIWSFEKEYIEYKENGYYTVDFPYVIKKELLVLGIKEENILLSNICTHCNTDDFFSYRDSTRKNEKRYGTEATIIELI